MTRYTIHFVIREVADNGDVSDEAVVESTMDWATTNLEILEDIMAQCYEDADNQIVKSTTDKDEISAREPDVA